MVTRLWGNGAGASCYWCRRKLQSTRSTGSAQATRDHLYPRSAGGTYRVWCCVACNNLKGEMRPNEWRAFMRANPNWWMLWGGHRKDRRQKPKALVNDWNPERVRALAREIVQSECL